MAWKKGRNVSIGDQLKGYEKIDKAKIPAGKGIIVENIIKGYSPDNGDYVYVLGDLDGSAVFTAVPAASLDEFMNITPEDLTEIKNGKVKFYVEERTSRSNRLYYVAWLDD